MHWEATLAIAAFAGQCHGLLPSSYCRPRRGGRSAMSAQIIHGGALDQAVRKYGGTPDSWLDLSTGINPNAYRVGDLPPSVWQRLPDKNSEEALLKAARRIYSVRDDMGIAAANGTQSLIELLPRVVSSERIAIVSPTYQEHELSWLKAGRHVEAIGRNAELPRLSNGLVAVNPNNPDGAVLSRERLGKLARELELRHGWLIVDEAFCDCTPEVSIIPSMGPNVIVLRSFGKFFGLAGLRLGFLVASPEITNRIEHLQGPWAISGPALEIGRRALGDLDWIETARRELPVRSGHLAASLRAAGFEIAGQNQLFVLAEHAFAPQIYEHLCKSNILVRRFADYPERLRFGLCGDNNQLQRLTGALSEAIKEIGDA